MSEHSRQAWDVCFESTQIGPGAQQITWWLLHWPNCSSCCSFTHTGRVCLLTTQQKTGRKNYSPGLRLTVKTWVVNSQLIHRITQKTLYNIQGQLACNSLVLVKVCSGFFFFWQYLLCLFIFIAAAQRLFFNLNSPIVYCIIWSENKYLLWPPPIFFFKIFFEHFSF